MPNYRFRKGLHLQLRGREYVVEQRLPNGNFQIRDVSTNEYRSVEEVYLVKSLFEGELQILGDAQDSTLRERKATRPLVSELGLLEDDLKERTKRRHDYVREIRAQKLNKLTQETLTPLIAKVSKEIGDPSPPSWITLYRWYRQCQTAGDDVRALIPAFKRRGNRRRKLSGGDSEKASAIVKIIDDVIAEKYLSRQRPTIESTCNTIYARIAEANRYRSPEDRLSLPHKVSLYRIVKKLDQYEVLKARFGSRIADHKYAATKQGPRPTRPLERVEIDHTKLDMLVVDQEMRLPIGRPWLTLALDVYSKMIVGVYISFTPPSYLSLMQCLRHAIRPKTYVKDRYPIIQNTWDAYGIPEVIVCDNGPEFYSTHFEDACLLLGITIHHAPVKRGQYKGSVERYFRTLNQKLLHENPGTTFSNIIDRAEYDSKKNAVISFEALIEIIHLFIVDIYHQSEHRTLRNMPAHVWKTAIEEYPPALPPQEASLDVLIGCVEKRTITALGVQLHTLFYNDEKLAGIRRRLKPREKVTVKYDPNDLSLIHVADKENGEYVLVPASNKNYTQNLTLWQHEIIKRYAQQRAKGNVDIVGLCLAKEEIQKIVEREWCKTRKTQPRQKMARFMNYEQQLKIEAGMHGRNRRELTLVQDGEENNLSRFGTDSTTESMSAAPGSSGAVAFLDANMISKRRKRLTASSAREYPKGSQNSFPPLVNASLHQRTENKDKEVSLIAVESDDTDLDMDGWKADYGLPK